MKTNFELQVPSKISKCYMKSDFLASDVSMEIHRTNRMIAVALAKQMDDVFIEGLRLKGFEFMGRHEVETFVRKRCRCEDNIELKQRMYYVDDAPFLFYDYSMGAELKWEQTKRQVMVSADFGRYRFV